MASAIPSISQPPQQTILYPTPATVKSQPFSTLWLDAFAAIPDEKVQLLINSAAVSFGSSEVLQHSQRNEAVLYGACHLLALRLYAEGIVSAPGGGGGVSGPVASVKLDGAASINFGVQAWTPEDLTDWLKQPSPFLSDLLRVLTALPPTMYVVGDTEALAEFALLAPYFDGGC